MGEDLLLFPLEFNRSVRVEARPERLSGDAGAILGREVLERLGITRWLTARLKDPRDPRLITHPLAELLHTAVLLLAQGHRDKDDADVLRDDGVLRLAVSTRRGVSALETPERAPWERPPRNPEVPEGLASQPTMSRLGRSLSSEANRETLREAILETAARRLRASRGGHRQRHLTIDLDSLPIEVHGHQPGSAHNGHYHARIYHPLAATCAETGDLLGLWLRRGNAHTADGALEVLLPLLDRVEARMAQVAAVRMDAGFPEEKLLAGLEERRTPYVSRIRNNKVLDRMAVPYVRRPPGRRPKEPRTWLYEMVHQAKSWSRPRRAVLVVMERQEDLFLHHFWLLTNWASEQVDAPALLELYRQRGTAEGHMGELMSVLEPALSSAPRPKSHYRGREPRHRTAPGDAFAQNEVTLLLNGLAYEVAHTLRVLLEDGTHKGWGLGAVRDRVLRSPARVLVHARRAVVVLGIEAMRWWRALCRRLALLRYAEA